jgi:hypothetical protein
MAAHGLVHNVELGEKIDDIAIAQPVHHSIPLPALP